MEINEGFKRSRDFCTKGAGKLKGGGSGGVSFSGYLASDLPVKVPKQEQREHSRQDGIVSQGTDKDTLLRGKF